MATYKLLKTDVRSPLNFAYFMLSWPFQDQVSTYAYILWNLDALKYLLKELAYKKFPKSLIDRPKKGFDVSIITITLKLLDNKSNSLLNKEIIQNQNLFNYEEIIVLKNEIINKNYKNIGLMWLFLIFQIWYLRFMNMKIQ